MNPHPNEQSTTNYQPPTNNPQDTSVVATSSSAAPPLSTVSPIANSQLPVTNPPHHFPFMMVTLFLAVVLAGFIGAYLFFSFSSNPPSLKPPSIITPPSATIALPSLAISPIIPAATTSSELTSTPSADMTPAVTASSSGIN